MALVAGFALVVPDGMASFAPAAWAEDDGDGDGQGGKPADKGNQGEGQKGQDNAGQGQGQGGPGEDSDSKGPQAGGPADASGGGKPVWAQEGIPEVELGRLSVARSPDQVLERALAEAVASLTPEMIAYYELSLEEAQAELALNFDNVAFVDSPLQNLALLEDLLKGGTALTSAVNNDTTLLAAMLLGAASDKTVPISTATVVAVTTILGTPVTGTAADTLAEMAEAIRIAILAGHG